MKTPLSFFVPGIAKPAGSKKAFPLFKGGVFVRSLITDASGPEGKVWRNMVAWKGKEALGTSRELWDCPIKLTLHFVVLRPKGHFKKKGGLSSSARAFPTTKPDLLKLARAVEDALTGIVWVDDSLVITEHLIKRYGSVPGVHVDIEEECGP